LAHPFPALSRHLPRRRAQVPEWVEEDPRAAAEGAAVAEAGRHYAEGNG